MRFEAVGDCRSWQGSDAMSAKGVIGNSLFGAAVVSGED
jgi:hypothetical protein